MTLKIVKLSLKAIRNNKMRSILTMLGIIIGVMAVVILVSITQGATDHPSVSSDRRDARRARERHRFSRYRA